MGILDKVGSAIKNVSDIAGELGNEDGVEGSLVSNLLKSEMAKSGKDKKKDDASISKTPKQEAIRQQKEREKVIVEPKYEGLRPLVRSALMNDEISEKTLETLRKKAVSLGMDADEFEIFFNGLVAKKKKAGKKPLIGKGEISYDKYFEGNDFDNDFDLVFLTEEERTAKKGKTSDEKSRKIDNVVGKAKSIGKIGSEVIGKYGGEILNKLG